MDGIVSISLELDRSEFDKAINTIQKSTYEVFADLRLNTEAFDKQMSEVLRESYAATVSLNLDASGFQKSLREELNKGYQLDVMAALDTRQFTRQLDEILKPKEVRIKAVLDSEDLDKQLQGYEIKARGTAGGGGKEDCCDSIVSAIGDLQKITNEINQSILSNSDRILKALGNNKPRGKGIGSVLTAPFRQAATGFFEGIGFNAATPLANSFIKSVETQVGSSLDNLGENLGTKIGQILDDAIAFIKNKPKKRKVKPETDDAQGEQKRRGDEKQKKNTSKQTQVDADEIGVKIASSIVKNLIKQFTGKYDFVVNPVLDALDFEAELERVLRDRIIRLKPIITEPVTPDGEPVKQKSAAAQSPESRSASPPRQPFAAQSAPKEDLFNKFSRMAGNVEKSAGLFQQTQGGIRTGTGEAIANIRKTTVTPAQFKESLAQLTKASQAAQSLVDRYKELQALGKEIIAQDPSKKKEVEDKLRTIGAKGKLAGTFLSQYGVKGAAGQYEVIGKNVIEGLKRGAKGGESIGKAIANSLSQGTKQALGIESPSKVFKEIGKFVPQGLSLGIDQSLNVISKAAHKLTSRLLKTVRDDLGIHSPSKEGEKDGENYVRGQQQGIDGQAKKLNFNSVKKNLKNSFNKILNNDSGARNKPRTIIPPVYRANDLPVLPSSEMAQQQRIKDVAEKLKEERRRKFRERLFLPITVPQKIFKQAKLNISELIKVTTAQAQYIIQGQWIPELIEQSKATINRVGNQLNQVQASIKGQITGRIDTARNQFNTQILPILQQRQQQAQYILQGQWIPGLIAQSKASINAVGNQLNQVQASIKGQITGKVDVIKNQFNAQVLPTLIEKQQQAQYIIQGQWLPGLIEQSKATINRVGNQLNQVQASIKGKITGKVDVIKNQFNTQVLPTLIEKQQQARYIIQGQWIPGLIEQSKATINRVGNQLNQVQASIKGQITGRIGTARNQFNTQILPILQQRQRQAQYIIQGRWIPGLIAQSKASINAVGSQLNQVQASIKGQISQVDTSTIVPILKEKVQQVQVFIQDQIKNQVRNLLNFNIFTKKQPQPILKALPSSEIMEAVRDAEIKAKQEFRIRQARLRSENIVEDKMFDFSLSQRAMMFYYGSIRTFKNAINKNQQIVNDFVVNTVTKTKNKINQINNQLNQFRSNLFTYGKNLFKKDDIPLYTPKKHDKPTTKLDDILRKISTSIKNLFQKKSEDTAKKISFLSQIIDVAAKPIKDEKQKTDSLLNTIFSVFKNKFSKQNTFKKTQLLAKPTKKELNPKTEEILQKYYDTIPDPWLDRAAAQNAQRIKQEEIRQKKIKKLEEEIRKKQEEIKKQETQARIREIEAQIKEKQEKIKQLSQSQDDLNQYLTNKTNPKAKKRDDFGIGEGSVAKAVNLYGRVRTGDMRGRERRLSELNQPLSMSLVKEIEKRIKALRIAEAQTRLKIAERVQAGEPRGKVAKEYADGLKFIREEIKKLENQLNGSIPALENQLELLRKSRSRLGASEGEAGRALDERIKKTEARLIRARQERAKLEEEAVKTSDAAEKGTRGFFGRLKNSLERQLLRFNIPKEAQKKAVGESVNFAFAGVGALAPLQTIGAFFSPIVVELTEFIAAFAAINAMLGGAIRSLAETLAILEPIQIRFETIAGSKKGGKQELEFAVGISDKLKTPLETSLNQYSKLMGAAMGTALEGQQIRELFEGISTAIAAMGLDAQAAESVFLAFGQMLSKGKLSAEEVRQQLAERFPPTMKVFSQALGTGIAEFNHLLESGQIGIDIFPKVTKVLKENFAKGAAEAANTFTAATTRVNNAMLKLKKTVLETPVFSGAFTPAQAIAGVSNFAASIMESMSSQTAGVLAQAGIAIGFGFGIQIMIGLAQVLRNAPLIKNITEVGTGVLRGAVKSTILAVTPFMIGVLADVADGWLGAQNSVFENMYQGIYNFLDGILQVVNNFGEKITGKTIIGAWVATPPNPDPWKTFFNTIGEGLKSVLNLVTPVSLGLTALSVIALPFAPTLAATVGTVSAATAIMSGFGTVLTNMFGAIPSGLVEMGALVLMFTQVAALGKMYLFPMFARLGNAIAGLTSTLTASLGSWAGIKAAFAELRLGATLLQGAIYGVLAVAIIAFARSDFTDPLRDQMVALDRQILGNVESIKNSFKELSNARDAALKRMSSNAGIPLKGFELNPAVWIGVSEESVKSDQKRLQTRRRELENLQKEAQKTDKSIDQVNFGGLKINTKARDEFRSFGINDITPVTGGLTSGLTIGEKQLLDRLKGAKDIQKQAEKDLSGFGLTAGKFGGFLNQKGVKESYNSIVDIERQVLSLSNRRASLVPFNTKEARNEIDKLDIRIKELLDQRQVKGKNLINIANSVKSNKEFLEQQIEAIKNSNYSAEVKQALINQIQPTLNLYAEAYKYLESQGISKIGDQLGYTWEKLASAIERAGVELEKFNHQLEMKDLRNQLSLQEKINKGELSQGRASAMATNNEISSLQEKATFQEQYLNKLRDNYQKLSTIPFTSTEQKKDLEDIKKDIIQTELDLARSRLDIAQKYGERRKQIEEKTLGDIERANNKTLAAIEQRQAINLAPVYSRLSQGEYWDEARADFELNQIKREAAQETTRAVIANIQDQMSAYRKMRGQGIIDETTYKDKMLSLNKDLASQSIQILDQQLDAQRAKMDEFLRQIQSQYDENIRGLRFDLGNQLQQGLDPNRAELGDLLGQIQETEKAINRISSRPNIDRIRSQNVNSQLSILERQKQKLISGAANRSMSFEGLAKFNQELNKLQSAIASLEKQKAFLAPITMTQKEREELRKLEGQLATLKNNYLQAAAAQREFQINLNTQQRTRALKRLEPGLLEEEINVRRLQNEKTTNEEMLALRQWQLKETERLNRDKFFSDNQYAEKRRGLLEQIGQLESSLVDNSIEIEKARFNAANALLDKEQELRGKLLDLKTDEINKERELKDAIRDTAIRRSELIQQGYSQQLQALSVLKESDEAIKNSKDAGEKRFLEARRNRMAALLGISPDAPDSRLSQKQRELDKRLAQEKLSLVQQEIALEREKLALEQKSARMSALKAANEAEILKAKADQKVLMLAEQLGKAKTPEEKAGIQDALRFALGEQQIAQGQFDAAKSYYENLQALQQRQAYNQRLQGRQQYQQAGFDAINANPNLLPGFTLNPRLPQFVIQRAKGGGSPHERLAGEVAPQSYQNILGRTMPNIQPPSTQIETRSGAWRGELDAAIRAIQPAIGNLEINNTINRPENIDDAALSRRLGNQIVSDIKESLAMIGF